MAIPNHIGIILDGNRRFAKRLLLQPWKGHEFGAQKLEKVFDWAKELGVKEITLYTFSVQNFSRPKEEFNYLMDLFRKEFDKLMNDGRLDRDKIKINFIGRLHLFSKDIQEKMLNLMEKTKDNNNFIINFAMAYGGREELVDAMSKMAKDIKAGSLKPEDIDEFMIDRYAYMSSQPEMIIRTSGERRLSGFLLWQSAYSELFFLDKFWPEFEKEDLAKCIEEYGSRDRRFGK
jgi:tritrans,polycis-undecaprenyl-diphosphate synthase [geranylgeranyl-diphosphate specific]